MRKQISKDATEFFFLGNLFLGIWPTIMSICFPNEDPLEKTNFSVTSGYQFTYLFTHICRYTYS